MATHPEEVLSKERLIQTVWPDTFVGDHVVTRCISELRRIFNDDAREPRFIQSIPKVGYRLIAPVQPTVAAEPPGVTITERSTQSGEHANAEARKDIYQARRFQIA